MGRFVARKSLNVQPGKQGFQPTTKGADAPQPVEAPAGARSWETSNEYAAAKQTERYTSQLQRVRLAAAADRLMGGGDLLPEQSGYVLPTPQDEERLVETVQWSETKSHNIADGEAARGRFGEGDFVVKSGPAGHVVWAQDPSGGGRHIVGVVQHPARDYRDVLMTVTTTNADEAQRLFDGAVTESGL